MYTHFIYLYTADQVLTQFFPLRIGQCRELCLQSLNCTSVTAVPSVFGEVACHVTHAFFLTIHDLVPTSDYSVTFIKSKS